MAQAYPGFEAGEGDTVGANGSASEWPYLVEVDDPSDDPLSVLFTVAPFNSPHPDSRFAGMLATDYRKDKRLNERWWRVFVQYSPASGEAVIGQWRRSVRFANEVRRIERSLGHFGSDGRVLDVALDIGPSKWEPTTTNSGTTAGGKNVSQKAAIDSSKAGIEINDGLMALNYEIVTWQLSITQLTTLMSYRWHTNNDKWPARTAFKAYPKWSLIFSNFAVDDEILNLPLSGPYWFSRVNFEILYRPLHPILNPVGWRGRVEYESYRDDEGYIAQVFKELSNGSFSPLTKNYVLYEEARFADIFGVTGYGQPGL